MNVVEIEATNLCNANCLMCPRDRLSRPKGHMSWETFQAVADKVLAYGQTESFSFSGIGEPLLNPLLPRMVAYVSPHARTILTSNGSRLDEATIHSLLEAGLDILILSFNGADAESYEQIMPPLRFDGTQAAIRRLGAMAGDRMELIANVTVSNLTKDRLPAIKGVLNQHGIDKIIYSHCHSRAGLLTDGAICSMPRPPATTRCDLFAETTFVAWTGQVLSCCHDLTAAGIVGDLTQMSMPELAAKRDGILREGVHFPMCADCDDLWRLGHDQPPPGGSLNEWVYRLYESEDSRTSALTEALRLRDGQLAEAQARAAAMESENAYLRQTVEGYESGRFIRFTRWLHQQRERLGL